MKRGGRSNRRRALTVAVALLFGASVAFLWPAPGREKYEDVEQAAVGESVPDDDVHAEVLSAAESPLDTPHTESSENGAGEQPSAAERFEELMLSSFETGGESLLEAFDIHDACLGVPRDDAAIEEWLLESSSVADLDVDRMRQRSAECKGVPSLLFETRRRILQPLATEEDPYAQYLLGALNPRGSEARTHWLRQAAAADYVPAMLLLAEDLVERGESEIGRIEAYRLLARAAQSGDETAVNGLAALEIKLTSGELLSAQSESSLEELVQQQSR